MQHETMSVALVILKMFCEIFVQVPQEDHLFPYWTFVFPIFEIYNVLVRLQ